MRLTESRYARQNLSFLPPFPHPEKKQNLHLSLHLKTKTKEMLEK